MQLDNTDLEILNILNKDARTKISEIAEQVHLSHTGVAKRMQRLTDTGIIKGYRLMLSPEALGYEIHGYMIGGVYRNSLEKLREYAVSVDEIVRMETIVSGGKEVIIEFYCRNMDHLLEFYKSGLRKYLDSMTAYLVRIHSDIDMPLPINKK